MMAVPVTLNPTFEPGLPVPLFSTQATSFSPYDVTPDGRFLINTIGGNTDLDFAHHCHAELAASGSQMSLASGTRLGAYEIVSLLGAGGMGEVYRARDTRLKRDVAIKVLPDCSRPIPTGLLGSSAKREVLASLNHPHIAAIYGIEDMSFDTLSIRSCALILELVEGATLAERIAPRGDYVGGSPGDCAADRRGAGSGARERHRASRSEAGEHQDHAGRCGQGPRLRTREGVDPENASAAAVNVLSNSPTLSITARHKPV